MTEKDKTTLSESKRCVYLSGEIDEASSLGFNTSILQLELADPTKDIVVIIDSYGGYVDSTWSMIDVMNLCRCEIHTVCVGKSMSGASLILMNGSKGKRYCSPKSRVMLHKISGGTKGNFDQMDCYMSEVARLEKEWEAFIVEKTKFTQKTLSLALRKDCYLVAKQAKAKGIVDNVIASFSDLNVNGW